MTVPNRQRDIDITKEERDRGLQECKTVAEWMFKKVLTPDTIMVIPVGRPGGNYRDTLPEPGRGGPPDTTFSPLYLPTAIGSPHIIVPGRKTYAPASSLREDQKTNFASRAEPIRIESFGECRVCSNCCVASRRKMSVTFYLRVRRRESHHFPTGTDTICSLSHRPHLTMRAGLRTF